MRAAIYARYSTDLQSDASIEDQHRLCLRLINGKGWQEARTYSDRGLSGALHLRPGYQQLLEDARHNAFDVVVAEGLDRISRDQEHIAGFFKQMRFQGIPIFTSSEGEICQMHIGLKGTMAAIFLEDLALKTHRGLEGRVRKGKSAGGVTYGYDVVRDICTDGSMTRGDRRINGDQAKIVQRIFLDYSHGLSPRTIATNLNEEGIPGPRATWGASTIYGNHQRGTGILNNELYIGRLVWNRQRFIKDPNNGKRQARLNPPEDWVIEDVSELRIVSDDLWNAVKARQEKTRNAAISDGIKKLGLTKRARHLFSGMLICGCCGGGVIQIGKQYYGCSSQKNKGTCNNKLTIKRDVLENRVLSGLKQHLLQPDLIKEYHEAYLDEYKSLARANRDGRANAEKKLAKVRLNIENILEAIASGMLHASMKEKLTSLESQKSQLENELQAIPEEDPVLLHPALSEKYQKQVANLTEALNDPCTKTEATSIIRSLISEIRLIPEDGKYAIELVGELAGLLALGAPQNEQSRPEAARLTLSSTVMVAGAGFEPATFRLVA